MSATPPMQLFTLVYTVMTFTKDICQVNFKLSDSLIYLMEHFCLHNNFQQHKYHLQIYSWKFFLFYDKYQDFNNHS